MREAADTGASPGCAPWILADRAGARARLGFRAEVANLTDAIASGMLRSSPALAVRLEKAERELARLEAEAKKPAHSSVAYVIPRLAHEYRALVSDLAKTLTGVNVPRARAELRKLVGELRVETTEEAVEVWSTQAAEQALLRLAGGSQQKILVAGARFVNFRRRVRLTRDK